MPDTERYRNLIGKLLALAQGSSFAAEAASARSMAEELMEKHNIHLALKDRSQYEINHYTPWAKGAQWEFDIVVALAKLCGCMTYFRGNFEMFVLVGSIADLEGLRFMIGEINRQRKRAWLQYKRTGPDSLWKFSYAYAQALDDKIDDILCDAPAINAQREKVKLWYESSHTISRDTHDWLRGRGSSTAGRDAGGNASLHRGSVNVAARQITHRK